MGDIDSNKKACLDLTFCACFRLRLDIEVASVALTILQKYMKSGLMNDVPKEEAQLVVTTCIFLASKTEENPRRLRDVINVTHKLTWANEVSNGNSSDETGVGGGGTMCLDNDYLLMKERVVHMEQRLLRCIGFDLEIGHPFCFLLHFTKFLNLPQDIVHHAWVLLVDSLWSPESSSAKHQVLATAAIYIALTNETEALMKHPWLIKAHRSIEGASSMTHHSDETVWWHTLGVEDEELASACELILQCQKNKALQ